MNLPPTGLHSMNIDLKMKELAHDHAILTSFCTQTSAGLEAIDSKSFIRHLRKLTQKCESIIRHILTNGTVSIELTSRDTFSLKKDVLKKPFTIVGKNTIYIPMGFEGKLSGFIGLLEDHKDNMLLTQQALTDANIVFSEYASKPEELMKLDPKRVPVLESVSDIPLEFGKYFRGETGSDRAEMMVVYNSYSDYNVVSDGLVSLSVVFANVDLKDISASVDDFYETLDIITKRIGTDTSVSKPTARAIGDLIYKLADWVALYSLYLTKLSSSIHAHKDTTKKLNGFF